MSETIEDVKRWLEFGVKAMFPFDEDTIAAIVQAKEFILAKLGGVAAYAVLVETKNKLQHRLDLFKITESIDEESQVYIGNYTVSLGANGKWIVEKTTDFNITGVDYIVQGAFTYAREAAEAVIKSLSNDHLTSAFTAELERQQYTEAGSKWQA